MAQHLNNQLTAVLLIALPLATLSAHHASLDSTQLALAARANLLYEEYATLADTEYWDADTVSQWQSSPTNGIFKQDWAMFHPDLHSDGKLESVGLPRTVPRFEQIDTNSDGSVDRAEFHQFVAQMEVMPAALSAQLEAQHNIRPGDTIKWSGAPGGWPWAGGETTTALSFERNYEGEVYLLVRSEQDRIPEPHTGSLTPGTMGRKVRIERVKSVQSPADTDRDALSATSVFELLSGGHNMLSLRECHFLALNKMIPTGKWAAVRKQGGLTRGQFVGLFHKYQFVPAMVAAAVNGRSVEHLDEIESGKTSCGVQVHCLSVHDVASTWPELPARSIGSLEWQRFGQISTTKAAGWNNAMALIEAFGQELEQKRLQGGIPGAHGDTLSHAHAQISVESQLEAQQAEKAQRVRQENEHALRVHEKEMEEAEEALRIHQQKQSAVEALRIEEQQRAKQATQIKQHQRAEQQRTDKALQAQQKAEEEQALRIQEEEEEEEEAEQASWIQQEVEAEQHHQQQQRVVEAFRLYEQQHAQRASWIQQQQQQQTAKQALQMQQQQQQREAEEASQRREEAYLGKLRRDAYLRELDEAIESNQRYMHELQDQRRLLEPQHRQGHGNGWHQLRHPNARSLFGW